jgi:hypothetical protein
MDTTPRTPPDKLFDLLKFCGIRQRDITTQFAVSKTLVSLWKSGQREIPPPRYSELLEYATKTMVVQISQWLRAIPQSSREEIDQQLQYFETFIQKLSAAQGARDLTPLYDRMRFSIAALHAAVKIEGPPHTWGDETLEYVAGESRMITNLATAIQRHRQAAMGTSQQLDTALQPAYQALRTAAQHPSTEGAREHAQPGDETVDDSTR